MEQLAEELAGRVRVVKVDVDPKGPVLEEFGSSGVPAYVLFRDGQEVDRLGRFPWFLRWRVTRMVNALTE